MFKTLVSHLRFSRITDETSARLVTSSLLNWVPSRNAGHSKWANIKHVKGAKDLEKSKIIVKYVQRVQVAIKVSGSADPLKNGRLAQVLEDAKEAKIPLTAINKAIENSQKAGSEGHDEVYAFKGPGRAVFLIHTFAQHRRKSKDLLNTIAKKYHCTWLTNSALHLFNHIGEIVCSTVNGKPITDDLLEEATNHAIETGAEDVTIAEHPEFGKCLVFSTGATNFYPVKNSLTKLGYHCASSDLVYQAVNTIPLNDDELAVAHAMYERIMEHEFVVAVYDNIQYNNNSSNEVSVNG